MSAAFKRLVRFVPESAPDRVLLGQPVDAALDVGRAIYDGTAAVSVEVFSGTSVLAPGKPTGVIERAKAILAPLTADEAGTIRCVGLNYKSHAAEVGLSTPSVPTVFLKPAAALASPSSAPDRQPVHLPKITQVDNSGDYEAELAVVIGKTAKNVGEHEAADYILGYTAANDVSSRTSQFAQSQWSFSKGFDESCPIGPTLVAAAELPDLAQARITGSLNGQVLQSSGLDDLIFSVPQLISFLSQGTTLPAGTVILTGTPAGVGTSRKPRVSLKAGDVFAVEITPHIGTLINKFANEE